MPPPDAPARAPRMLAPARERDRASVEDRPAEHDAERRPGDRQIEGLVEREQVTQSPDAVAAVQRHAGNAAAARLAERERAASDAEPSVDPRREEPLPSDGEAVGTGASPQREEARPDALPDAQPSPGGSLRSQPAPEPRPPRDDVAGRLAAFASAPTVEAWVGLMTAATAALEAPALDAAAEAPVAIQEEGAALRDGQEVDPEEVLSEARSSVRAPPEPDEPAPEPVPADPVPEAMARVERAAAARLADRHLPAPVRSPGHEGVNGGRGQLPTLRPRITPDDADRPAAEVPEPEADDRAREDDRDAPADELAEAEGEPIPFTDEREDVPELVSDEVRADTATVLAQVYARVPEMAMAFARSGAAAAYPQQALLGPDVLDRGGAEIRDDLAREETATIREELSQVASAAGVAEGELERRGAVLRTRLALDQDEALAEIEAAAEEEVDELAVVGESTLGFVLAASRAVQRELEDQSSVGTGADPEAIRRRREERIAEIGRIAAEGLAALRLAADALTADLTRQGDELARAYLVTADAEARAIRLLTDDEAAGRLAALPTLDWGDEQSRLVRERVELETGRVSDDAQSLQDAIRRAARQSRDDVRDWAAERLGRERSWWERLFEMLQDWLAQADAEREAWTEATAERTRDETIRDLQRLQTLRDALARGATDDAEAALSSLSEAEGVVVEDFLYGGDRDALRAVATGMIYRLQQRRIPALTERARAEALDRDLSWEALDALGKAQDPAFDANALARDLHDAIYGLGTTHEKIWRSLEGRTPVQLAAIRARYLRYGGPTLEEDLRDDLSFSDQERALGALRGDPVEAAVAAIHGAIGVVYDDEQVVLDVLRGKTPRQREQIVARYRQRHGRDLRDLLSANLSDREYDRATTLLRDDLGADEAAARADAIGIADARAAFWGTDHEAVAAIYEANLDEVTREADRRGLTTAQLDARIRQRHGRIADEYASLSTSDALEGAYGGGSLTAAIERDYAEGDLNRQERDLLLGLHSHDPTRVDAARMRIETTAFVTSDNRVNELLRRPYERARDDAQRDRRVRLGELRGRLAAGEIGPGEYETERQALTEAVQETIRTQSAAHQEAFQRAYEDSYDRFLVLDVALTTFGYSTDEAFDLIESDGQLTPAQEIYYAIRGEGTDHERVLRILNAQSAEEAQKLRGDFSDLCLELEGARCDLDQELLGTGWPLSGEVSGDLAFDVEEALQGQPGTPAERLQRLQARVQHERDGRSERYRTSPETQFAADLLTPTVSSFALDAASLGVGVGTDLLSETEMHAMEGGLAEAEAAFDDYQAALDAYRREHPAQADGAEQDPEVVRLRERFERFARSVEGDVQSYRGAVERVADYAGTAAEVTIVIVVAVGAGLASGGTGTAGTASAYFTYLGTTATGAALTAAGSAGAGVTVRYAIRGDAYETEAILRDLGVGAVDAVASAATFGTSRIVLQGARLGRMAEGTVGRRLLAHALAEGAEGAVGALPSGLAAGLLDERTYRSDDPLLAIGLSTGMGVAMGTGLSATLGAVGSIRQPHAGGVGDAIQIDSVAPRPRPDGADVQAPAAPPRPVEELAAPRAEIRDALPPDLRGRLFVDDALPERSVRVYFEAGADGLVTSVHVRMGRGASAADVAGHLQTVRLVERYAGMSGRVRALLRRIADWFGLHGPSRPGELAFDTAAEIRKLPGLLRNRQRRLADGSLRPDERALVEADIDALERQLAAHRRTLDAIHEDPSLGRAPSRGFIAADLDGPERGVAVLPLGGDGDIGVVIRPGDDDIGVTVPMDELPGVDFLLRSLGDDLDQIAPDRLAALRDDLQRLVDAGDRGRYLLDRYEVGEIAAMSERERVGLRDYLRLLDEGSAYMRRTWADPRAFVARYESGRVFDFDGSWPLADSASTPSLRLPDDATPASTFAHLQSESPSYESFHAMLVRLGLDDVSGTQARAFLGERSTLGGLTEDTVRHWLKEQFRPLVLDAIGGPPSGSSARPGFLAALQSAYPGLPWTDAPAVAFQRASYREMRRAVEGLNESDRGNLIEAWYRRVHVPDASAHVAVSREDSMISGLLRDIDRLREPSAVGLTPAQLGPDGTMVDLPGGQRGEVLHIDGEAMLMVHGPADDLLVGDRAPDLIGPTGTLREIKSVTRRLAGRDLEQAEDFVRLVRERATVGVGGAGSQRAARQVRNGVYVFTMPEGAVANGDFIVRHLQDLENFRAEVFAESGASHILTRSTVLPTSDGGTVTLGTLDPDNPAQMALARDALRLLLGT